MHRGFLLLPWLALAALAHIADADETPSPQTSSARHGSASAKLSPSDRVPAGRPALDPMPGLRHPIVDEAVVPAAYVAREEYPPEPLGFSAARFNPNPGPLVDPALGPGMTYGPYRGSFEFYDPHDPDSPAPTVSSGAWIRTGCWYGDVAATYIGRSAAVKNDIKMSFDFFSQQNVIASQQDMGYQPGLNITLGRYLGRDSQNRDHSVEFTFLGLNHWQFSKSITAVQSGSILLSLDSAANPPVFEGSDFQSLNQTSDFNSYEFNYRVDRRLSRDRMVYSRDSTWTREATPGWVCSFISGIRTVIVNDRLYWFAQNSLGTGNYTVMAHNNLVGPQVGGEFFYDRAYWRLGIRGKAGALVNFASQSSTVQILDGNGDPLSPNRNEYAKDHSMSFVGGVTFLGEYRFRPNLGLKASFDMLWVTDLALAQNQLTFFPSTPTQISASHQLFFNGFSLGLEWSR